MPGQIEGAFLILAEILDGKALERKLEIAPVEDIKFAKTDTARPSSMAPWYSPRQASAKAK